MFIGWAENLLTGMRTLNQILTAGIAITAFSLLLYAFTFNLKDRVARSFAIILIAVVVIFTSDAIQSSVESLEIADLFLRLQWIGIIFLPPAYLHLSDAVLVTAGRPSRGRRRIAVRGVYALSAIFVLLLAFGYLVGPLITTESPAPHLQHTFWTSVFSFYYLMVIGWAGLNLIRAYGRMLTRSGSRRMLYLMVGAAAPALGSYPFLMYGSSFASQYQLLFWGVATLINVAVGALLIIMAYAVAFFGVSWPDRVVKSRLFKWIMRGPVTASLALGVMTILRRAGEWFGLPYNAGVPLSVVGIILLMEHLITIVSPIWERILFYGGDRTELTLLQNIEERLLTQSDLRQFLEAVLAAVRDHMQAPSAFVASMDDYQAPIVITAGKLIDIEESLNEIAPLTENLTERQDLRWKDYWIFPLRQRRNDDMDLDEVPDLLGLMGVSAQAETLEQDQRQALWLLAERAALALEDRQLQQRVFRSLEDLDLESDRINRLRAASRYDSTINLLTEETENQREMGDWVREALNHYWGGPKLTESPLMSLRVVQQIADEEHEGNKPNALRAILKQAVEQIRPEGERRFTSEWILYNILDLKFIEGRKVKEVAAKLAMSEADLYRKQRIAVDSVARAILEIENEWLEKV